MLLLLLLHLLAYSLTVKFFTSLRGYNTVDFIHLVILWYIQILLGVIHSGDNGSIVLGLARRVSDHSLRGPTTQVLSCDSTSDEAAILHLQAVHIGLGNSGLLLLRANSMLGVIIILLLLLLLLRDLLLLIVRLLCQMVCLHTTWDWTWSILSWVVGGARVSWVRTVHDAGSWSQVDVSTTLFSLNIFVDILDIWNHRVLSWRELVVLQFLLVRRLLYLSVHSSLLLILLLLLRLLLHRGLSGGRSTTHRAEAYLSQRCVVVRLLLLDVVVVVQLLLLM